MIRWLVRLFLSPPVLAAIDLLIFVPLLLAVIDVSRDLWRGTDLREPMGVAEGMGVILIGWGVALEERSALRQIFALASLHNEARQEAWDYVCHSCGLGLLVFGLFSEMGVEVASLPNRILNTHGFKESILGASTLFLALGLFVLLYHLCGLAGVTLRHRRVAADAR